MAEPGSPMATGTAQIDATPDVVFSLVTDLAELAALAEEAESMQWVRGSRAEPGAVFAGRNRNGLRRWTTRCTVTDASPGASFAFDVTYGQLSTPIAHWRYDLEPTNAGCLVTESMWDRRPGWFRSVAGLATGVSDRAAVNSEHIAVTLRRLGERATRAR